MDERQSKEHKDFIQPGSKEDAEATAAINEAFDQISKRSTEQYRQEREAAERERERRVRSGLPLEDRCFFARLTSGMHVRDEDLFGLFQEHKIAVRLKGGGSSVPSSTDWEPDPKDYRFYEREMVTALLHLRKKGGYVWLEFQHSNKAKVGVVTPGTSIGGRKVRRTPKKYGKKGVDAGTEVSVLTMRLTKIRGFQPDEEIALRASRPLVPDHVNRSLVSWSPACGADRLISMFDGHRKKDPEERWHTLPAALRTTVCAEYLRHHELPGVPRLRRLLLPPTNIGRDVDIYGVAEDETQILAQVPFRQNPDKEGFEASQKAQRLRKYENSGVKLICFVPGSGGDDEYPNPEQNLFEDQASATRDEVFFVPIGEVLKWIKGQPEYARMLLLA